MTGTKNEGFEVTEDEAQENTKKESNDDMSVDLPNPKPDLEDQGKKVDLNNTNLLVKYNLKARAWLAKLLFGDNKITKFFRAAFIHGCAMVILAMSINRSESPIDCCDGVGFLWILYGLVYFGIIFSFLKRLFGKSMKSSFKQISCSCLANKYFRFFCYITPVIALAAYVIISPGKSGRRIYSFLGIMVFMLFGFFFSKYPGHINWRPVISGMVLQFVFGLIIIQVEVGKNIMDCIGRKVTGFLQYSEEGAVFVYGELSKTGTQPPIFAFTVLPVIFFLSFFISMLSYYGALQWFILKTSRIVEIVMGTTVCESVYSTASIFLGMTEAPLIIRDYLNDVTKSELCAIMCAGWSTVAGVVLAAYVKFGIKASHIIAASFMSAPASLAFSKLFYPETEQSKNTVTQLVLHKEEAANVLDAASKGAIKAIEIVLCITAGIIAFLAFVAFLDGTLIWVGHLTGLDELSFQFIMSKIFYPVTFLMGVDEDSVEDIAYLVGVKTVVNEFQAYKMLGELIKANKLSERSEVIATYALCGFSNFGSIGITIAAISAVEPRKRAMATEVALPAFVSANIVCFLTACVAGCLID